MFGGELEASAVAFFAAAFERHAAEAADAYAVGLYIDFEDDDTRRPVVTAGFNSQAGIDAALARSPGPFQRRPVPADAEEARWDFAFWSHSDLARFGDPDEDPEGAAALERWIRLSGWWYSDEEEDADLGRTLDLGDEIVRGLDQVMTAVARELQRDAIPRVARAPAAGAAPRPRLRLEFRRPRRGRRTRPASPTTSPPGRSARSTWTRLSAPERDTTFDWVDTRRRPVVRARGRCSPSSPHIVWIILRAITYEGPPTVGRSERDLAYIAVAAPPRLHPLRARAVQSPERRRSRRAGTPRAG